MATTNPITGVRFEILNDVHGRWAPIESVNGGTCVPNSHVVDLDEYKTACPNTIGGAARAVTAMEQGVNNNNKDDQIIRVLNGDEFTGTPLFSASVFSDADPDTNSGFGAALNHIPNLMRKPVAAADAVDPILLLTLGNHELDLGLDVLSGYYDQMINNHDATLLCGNCNFTNDSDCSWTTTYNSHISVDVDSENKLGIWGMTVPDMHSVSVLPKECTITPFDDSAFTSAFDKFVEDHDYIVILSHMGLDQDIKFADSYEERITGNKEFLIFGGHTHSVMCDGSDGSDFVVDLNGSKPQTNLDAQLPGSNGMVACDLKADFEKSIMELATGYNKVTINTIDYELPSYALKVGTNTTIYHHAMFGNILGKLRLSIQDGSLAIDESEPKYTILNSAISLDQVTMEEQLEDINKLVDLNSNYIGLADQAIDGSCSSAPSGCDGGYLLAMSLATTGIERLAPNVESAYEGGVVGFVSGNSIMASLPEGQVSLGGIYSTYPYLNALSGMMVKGDNLIENLTHGIFGWGGGQMFGARVVLPPLETIESITDIFKTDAQAKDTTIDRYFCTDKYDGTTTTTGASRSSDYVSAYTINKELKSQSVTRADITDDERVETPTNGIGCYPVNDDENISFEINICAMKHFNEVRSTGSSTIDYFPPSFYNDCQCWEKVDPSKEYMILSIDYVMNGGKGHCFQDAGSTRYDTSAPHTNGEVGCAATVIDFFQTYQDNISGGVGLQVAVEAQETTVAPSGAIAGVTTFIGSVVLALF